MAAVQGNRHHDNIDRGAPVKIGGKAKTTDPAAVADGDRVDAYFDEIGRLVVKAENADGTDISGGAGGGDGAILDGASALIKATVSDLANSNPLNVAITDGSGDQITSFGGGVQYTEADTDASITGTAVLWEDGSDTLRAVSAAKPLPIGDAGGSLTVDGSVAVSAVSGTVAVTQSGTWDEVGINDSGNSITVDNATISVVGSGTEATAQRVTIATDSTGVLSVDDNGGSLTVDTPGGFGGGVQYTEGETDLTVTGNAIMWRDEDSLLQTTSTAMPLPVNLVADSGNSLTVDDGSGSLTVDGTLAVTQSGTWDEVGINDSGNSITVDNATISVVGTGTEATAQRVTIATDSTGVLSVDDNGSTLSIDDGGGIITVDGTVTANLAAGTNNIGDVDVLSIAAGDNNIGNVDIVTLPALVASSANIGDVDVLTVPADPFGVNADAVVAAGAAGSIQAKLRRLTTDIDAIKTSVAAATPAGTNNIGDVDVLTLPALVAGTANIGDVDVLTLPALPAGTNNIGDVDVLTLPGVGGLAAHAAATSGNPVYVAGRASAALPTDVGADGDAAGFWLERHGAQIVSQVPHLPFLGTPYTLTAKTVTATTAQTGVDIWSPTSGKILVITSIQIQTFATTAGTCQVWFGLTADTTYSRGTDLAIFDGEFAPSATLKPGWSAQGLWIGPAVDSELHYTTTNSLSIIITVWGYEV